VTFSALEIGFLTAQQEAGSLVWIIVHSPHLFSLYFLGAFV